MFFNLFNFIIKSKDLRSGGGEIAMEILGLIVREHRTPDGKKNFLEDFVEIIYLRWTSDFFGDKKTNEFNRILN